MKASASSVRSSTWNKNILSRGAVPVAFAGALIVVGAYLVPLIAGAFLFPSRELRAQSSPAGKTSGGKSPAKKTGKNSMIHPMRSPVYISGSFGEYRNYGRFHYGVDYKTFNRNGLPVLMPAGGVVRRLQVSDRGYGNALFIASGSSMFTFAHLQDFAGVIPDLEYLRSALDYLRPTDRTNLAVPAWFRFRRGQVVARSGESGSGAPHLHFEVRRGGRYYNALSFQGLNIRDRTAPVLRHLYVEFGGNVRRLPLRTAGGGADIADPAGAQKRLTVIQPYGLGPATKGDAGPTAALMDAKTNSVIVPESEIVRLRIGTYDTMAAQNRNGVQSLEMSVDGKPVFKRDLNRLRLSDLNRADKTYDTVRTIIGREYVYLLFDAGSGKTGAAGLSGSGKKSVPPIARKVSIQVGDGVGNLAVLDFKLVFRDALPSGQNRGSSAAGKPAEPDDVFTKVGPRGKKIVSARSGGAELSLSFPAGTLHLPGLVRIVPLANPPREKKNPGPAGAAPERPAFDVAGAAFDVRARNLYYRRFARGKARFPAKKDLPVGLFGYHAASGRYRLVALPYKRAKGFAHYRFTYRMVGPIAQLVDRAPPRVANRFRWKPPADEKKSNVLIREYILSDRGTGVSKRRTRVLLDGNHLPFEFIRDRSTLRIEIPRSMIPKRGAMLSVRTGDFADNKSDWYFDFVSAGSR